MILVNSKISHFTSGTYSQCGWFWSTSGLQCMCTPVAELHGLSSSRPFIKQGRVGYGHACDVTNHGLVVEEWLQATLRDFRLVGCVLSHPENKTGAASQSEFGHKDNSTKLGYSARRGRKPECMVLLKRLGACAGNMWWLIMILSKEILSWKHHLISHECKPNGMKSHYTLLEAAASNYLKIISSSICVRLRQASVWIHLPAWVLQQIPLDRWWHRAVVVAHANVGPPDFVHWCNLL